MDGLKNGSVKNKIKIIFVVLFGLCVILQSISYMLKQTRIIYLEEEIEVKDFQIELLKTEITSLKIGEIKEELHKVNRNKINPKVLAWVKERASFRIPDQFLINYILEVKKYKHELLMLAIMAEESNFRFFAHSEKNARGLTQIIPDVWLTELKNNGIIANHNDLWDYKKNIKACNYILDDYFKRYKTLKNVLTRYSGGDILYAKKVIKNLKELEGL